jgi:hypothetical protein
MAEAHLPGLLVCFAFYWTSVKDFLFPDASLNKQPELGAQHGAQLPITTPTQRRCNSESLKV